MILIAQFDTMDNPPPPERDKQNEYPLSLNINSLILKSFQINNMVVEGCLF